MSKSRGINDCDLKYNFLTTMPRDTKSPVRGSVYLLYYCSFLGGENVRSNDFNN